MSTDTLELYGFPGTEPQQPSASPFTAKVECVLRIARVPYRLNAVANPGSAPRAKLPYMEDGQDIVPDSEHIIAYLKAVRGIDLDAQLTPQQLAQSHALQRMLEERLYWVIVYSRWVDPANKGVVLDKFFHVVPALVRGLVFRKALKSTKAALHHHGLGRHTPDEIYGFAARDLEAVENMLGEGPFLFGQTPTLADAVAFAALTNILTPSFNSRLKDMLLVRPRLVEFEARMRALYEAGAPNQSSSQ